MNDCISIIVDYVFETKTKCLSVWEVEKDRREQFTDYQSWRHLHPHLRVLPTRSATGPEDYLKKYGVQFVRKAFRGINARDFPFYRRYADQKFGPYALCPCPGGFYEPYYDFRCDKCDVVCNGLKQFNAHLNGRKHNRICGERKKKKRRRVSREYRIIKKKNRLKKELFQWLSDGSS